MQNRIELGQECRCRVTGFRGIATARAEYLNGCVQYCIHPPVDEKGDRREAHYIDQEQLEIVADGVAIQRSDTGGPKADCPSPSYRG